MTDFEDLEKIIVGGDNIGKSVQSGDIACDNIICDNIANEDIASDVIMSEDIASGDIIVEDIPSSDNIVEGTGDTTAGAWRFLWPALAFVIPFAIHALAFAVLGISPFGSRAKSMMVIDNFHQYSPFLSEYRDILKNGGNLLYSWNSGLGSNYWARYAYYLASPLNLLFVFFPAQSLPEFIVFLTLFRTGFSGLTFYIYARGKSGKAGIDGVAFASMYAISAYTLAYYWNIMWFDSIALLPLIALGLERLARGRRGVMYCITLAIAMYSNYYIALIICIFISIYFVAYSAAEARFTFKNFMRRFANFAAYSALSAGLAAVILLPTWSALSVSQSAGAKFPTRLDFYYNAFEILSGHLFNVTPSVMSGKPNLYCGTAALILIPLYFINRKFNLREKAAYGILLAFMMLSCNINYLNFIWHGLHFPNSLPYRFTFVYIFVIAALCFKVYTNADGIPSGAAFKALAAAAAYTLIMEKITPDITGPDIVYPSLVFLGLNAASIAWAAWSAREAREDRADRAARAARSSIIIRPAEQRLTVPTASIIMLLLTTVELTINAGFGIGAAGAGQRDNYTQNLDEVKEAVAGVADIGLLANSAYAAERGDVDFYRMEFLKDTVSNTPSLYGYKGASYFSSTAVLKVTDLMEHLGFRPSSAWYIYKGSTPVINAMLSLRYLMSKEDTYDNPLYPLVGEINGITVYENPYYLPLGFYADRDLLSMSVNQSNIFKIQNDFLKRSVGADYRLHDVLNPVEIVHKESKNAEITSQSGNLYHFRVLDTQEPGFINFTISSEQLKTSTGANVGAGAGILTDVSELDDASAGAASNIGAAPKRPPLYLYIQSRQIDYMWYIKGSRSEGHNIKNYPYIIDMQYFGDADEIEISLKIEEYASGDFEMYACSFDEDAFAEAFAILNSTPLTLDSFSDTRFSGTINADKPGVLFTSIPYDRGWSARIDGVKLQPDEIELFGEGFIALNIRSGSHKIDFSYIPVNFINGLLISLLSAGILFALLVIKRTG